MSSTAKISISIAEPELLSWARQRAESRGTSLSAVFAEAVRLEQQTEARGRVLDWIGPDGEPSPAEAATILAEWRGPSSTDGPVRAPRAKRARAKR